MCKKYPNVAKLLKIQITDFCRQFKAMPVMPRSNCNDSDQHDLLQDFEIPVSSLFNESCIKNNFEDEI